MRVSSLGIVVADLWKRMQGWQRLTYPTAASFVAFAAILVGISTGYASVFFIWLLDYLEHLFFDVFYNYLFQLGLGHLAIILIPVLGALAAGPLITFFAPEAKGHGVPEVMMAIVLKNGKMRPVVALIKAVASAFCLGSGGSAGREGPIVQIGSVLGSVIGQWLHMSTEQVQTLVAAGSGAGIAAVFNAPIAGSMFAIEIISGEFSTANFGSVIVAAVTASIIARHYLGEAPAFAMPSYSLVSPQELLLYAILGILAALVAYLFVQALYATEDIFDNWHFPDYLKPAAGAIILGVVGYFAPYSLGTGLPWIASALAGEVFWRVMLIAAFVKILSTSLTLGSGNSGGIFAPSLLMGAMLGGAFGVGVNHLWPTITGTYQAYALAGMAALFAGAARAPLTAIIMVFEMSNDYRMILPLMFATATSVLVSVILSSESIYTLKLVRRGIHLQREREIDVMQGVTVQEVMTTNIEHVDPENSLQELERIFETTHHHGMPVTDREGQFVGLVTIADLERAKAMGKFPAGRVIDITNTHPVIAYPDEPVWYALRAMGEKDVGRLPVVDREDPTKLLGMLRRGDLVRAYQRGIQKRLHAHTAADRMRLAHLTGMSVRELTVQPGAPIAGKAIKDARIMPGVLLVTLKRQGNVAVIHGDVILRPGDKVTVLVKSRASDQVQSLFSPRKEEKEIYRHKAPFE